MKALVGAFNQEKALVGAFSVIVQPVVEPMDRFTALVTIIITIPPLQTVAITERKQMCSVGGARRLTTTKICFTYPDASWVCRQPGTAPQQCDR